MKSGVKCDNCGEDVGDFYYKCYGPERETHKNYCRKCSGCIALHDRYQEVRIFDDEGSHVVKFEFTDMKELGRRK